MRPFNPVLPIVQRFHESFSNTLLLPEIGCTLRVPLSNRIHYWRNLSVCMHAACKYNVKQSILWADLSISCWLDTHNDRFLNFQKYGTRNSYIFTSILQIRYNIFICLITIVILSGGVTCKTPFVHKSTYQPPKARKVSFFCNWRMQMLHERGLVLHSTCRTQIYRGNNNYPVDA